MFNDYFDGHNVPHGISKKIEPLFDDFLSDPKHVLSRLREFLECMLTHLSTLSNIKINEIEGKIEKLTSIKTIDHQISPYFQLWWRLSCLGSHFQIENTNEHLWQEHLTMCRKASSICIKWYIKKYPPLDITDYTRNEWLKDAFFSLSSSYIKIDTFNENYKNKLTKNNILIFYGQSWVGKTSIATGIVTDYVNDGFIPIVIHESSLVTSNLISKSFSEINVKNLRLNNNANVIHEIICSRLIHGDSFIIFLDDPFGHRRFNHYNPLMYLRISDWIRLTKNSHCFGKLHVVITTPATFLQQGRKELYENGKINRVSQNNLTCLDDSNCELVQINMYNKLQLKCIFESIAKNHGCLWHSNLTYIDLAVDTFLENNIKFDAFHILSRENKVLSDDNFLNSIYNISQIADIETEIINTSEKEQIQLCAAYVGEALIELYRDFTFQTKLDFADLCIATGFAYSQNDVSFLKINSEWLIADKISTFNLSNFPVFLHPEVRTAVAFVAETKMEKTIRSIVVNICNIYDKSISSTLAKWESTHLVCRLARFLEPSDAEIVNNNLFCLAKVRGGDPRNVLWSILGNWHYIKNTNLENYSIKFIDTLEFNHKFLIRPYLWEALQNWIYLDNKLRLQSLKFTGTGSTIDDIKPVFNNENTLAFISAGVYHYGILQDCAQSGCQISEKYIEFLNIFITQIANESKRNFWTSRMGDGIFDSPGSKFNAKNIFEKLIDIGYKSGSFYDDHPFVVLVKTLLETKLVNSQ